jgi:hypothetical protein
MLSENPARPSPGSRSANAVRMGLLRSRQLRGRLAGLGQADGSGDILSPDFSVLSPDFSGDQALTDFSATLATLPAPVMNVPLQVDVPDPLTGLPIAPTPLPTISLANQIASNPNTTLSAPDAYGNQLIGITNPDGSITMTGAVNSNTNQAAFVNPSSQQSVGTQLANAIGNLSKNAATIFGGTSAQIAAAGKPAGVTSGISRFLSGSTGEYIVFGGVGLILILALASGRRR